MYDVFYSGPKPNLFAHEQPAEDYTEAALCASTSHFWLLDGNNDYTDFNFDWYPHHSQSHYISTFPSQHQDDGRTYFAKTENALSKDKHYVDDGTIVPRNEIPIYNISFESCHPCNATRFNDSYLDTLKRIVRKAESPYIWVTTDICDYSNFDFTWHPNIFQEDQLHVFSDGQTEFGDTFYINVRHFERQMHRVELLEWMGVNWCKDQIVPRVPFEEIWYFGDDLTAFIMKHDFKHPYALFHPAHFVQPQIKFTPSLWRQKDRAIHSFTESNGIVMCPRDAKQFLKTQCYDYPHILKHREHFIDETPLNIVFISNGETHAQRNYDHLKKITENVPNTLLHVQGVKGRKEAYQAAAQASHTDWFFAVFAKLEVDEDFDWGWQVDRFQEPKHYIFYARNPTVGINYGHASIIAYNRKLAIMNPAEGLDFTLDQPHEVVPVHSGVTHYYGDTRTAWRTSFREAIKLYKNICDGNFVEESRERLDKWCASNGTPEGDWNAKGGLAGVDYYKEVKGDFDSLRLSYDWEWLDDRYHQLYGSQ